jgi:osmotically-inducible protein OsmY
MKKAEGLRQDVIDEMMWDSSLDATGIGVAVQDGAVTLTGHVRSCEENLAAEKAARRVHGVVAVSSELEVRLPSGLLKNETDSATAASATPPLPGTVSAKAELGWVTLSGEVTSACERTAAETAVRNLARVRGVTNQIVVRDNGIRGAHVPVLVCPAWAAGNVRLRQTSRSS